MAHLTTTPASSAGVVADRVDRSARRASVPHEDLEFFASDDPINADFASASSKWGYFHHTGSPGVGESHRPRPNLTTVRLGERPAMATTTAGCCFVIAFSTLLPAAGSEPPRTMATLEAPPSVERTKRVSTTTPLHPKLAQITTLGMGTGGYNDVVHEKYSRVSWVLNSPKWFTDAGWVAPNHPGNILDTLERADAYATFVASWILETLHLVQHRDGDPIAIDLEDQGVDVALSYADWALAVVEAQGNPAAWVHGNPYQTGVYNAAWATCEANVIHALRRVTDLVRTAYPQSPIGWYNGGPHIYSPWCGRLGEGATSPNYKVADKYFELTAARDPRMNSWKWVDPNGINADFGFVTFYPNLTNVASHPELTHFTTGNRESLQNWNYLVLKHGGPSTAGWAGLWDRMFIGQPQQWVVSTPTVYANQKHPLESVCENGLVGQVSCDGTADPNALAAWKQSHLMSEDFYTALEAKGPRPGGIVNPNQPIDVLLDYLAWQWTVDCDRMPDGYQTAAHRPSAADAGTGAVLPDRFHQMKFGIWDAFFTAPHDFDAQVITCGPRDEIAAGLLAGSNLPTPFMKLLARLYSAPEFYAVASRLENVNLGSVEIAGLLDERAIRYSEFVTRRLGQFMDGSAGGVEHQCPADLDGDGLVNATDLGLLLGRFGTCHFGCNGDFDHDRDVDATDLGQLLGRWGTCP